VKPRGEFESISQVGNGEHLWRRKTWRRAGTPLSILALVLSLWVLIAPEPYNAAVAVTGLCPLFAIAITKASGRQFALMSDDEPGRMGIGPLFLLPGSILALRVFWDYQLVHIGEDSLKVAASMAVLLSILVSAAWWVDRSIATGALVIIACFWAYGATLEINGLLDHSPGTSYATSVIDKHEYEGSKYRTHELVLAPIGPFLNSYYLEVGNRRYRSLAIGQTVQVRVRNGALGIAWCYLD
jgi:hypothetical protein